MAQQSDTQAQRKTAAEFWKDEYTQMYRWFVINNPVALFDYVLRGEEE
jgi:hypothetical protein